MLPSEQSRCGQLQTSSMGMGSKRGGGPGGVTASSRLLQNDSEQPSLVEASHVRVERLGLTDHGFMTGKGSSERVEAPIRIYIVDHDCAVGVQSRPGAIQLEAHVALTVETVVNEKVHLAKMRKQVGKPPAARPLDVRPAIAVTVAYRQADLLAPVPFERWKVDTPQMTISV